MVLVAEPPPMASESQSKPVRVRPDIHSMLKVIEAASEIQGKPFNTITYLDALVRDKITADYSKALTVLNKAQHK
jgi:hypothetical protein